MRVDRPNNINNVVDKYKTMNKTNIENKNIGLSGVEEVELPIIFEELDLEMMTKVYDLKSIEMLKRESEDLYGQVVKVVKEMLSDQTKVYELSKGLEKLNIDKSLIDEVKEILSKIDAELSPTTNEEIEKRVEDLIFKGIDTEVKQFTGKNTEQAKEEIKNLLVKEEVKDIDKNLIQDSKSLISPKENEEVKALIVRAKALISKEGKMGVESVSKEIVEYVKAVSDGDIKKTKALIGAVDRGFNETQKTLADLPEITQKTYDKIIEEVDKFIAIERYKANPANIEVQIKEMIEDIITKQGKVIEGLNRNDGVRLEEAEITLLRSLIRLDGRLGIEHMSDKMVGFIKMAADNDTEKLNNLMKMLDRIFRETEQGLGKLPEISYKTYEKIMEKLKDWEEELKEFKAPLQVIRDGIKRYLNLLRETKVLGINAYVFIIAGWFLVYYLFLIK